MGDKNFIENPDMVLLTLPDPPEGAEGWSVFRARPMLYGGLWDSTDTRPWWKRTIYRVLMKAHDHAESLWHWLYRISRPFAPGWIAPPESIGPVTYFVTVKKDTTRD